MGRGSVYTTGSVVYMSTLCSVHLPVNLVLLLRYYSHHGYEIVLGKQSQNVHFIQQCMTCVGKASCLMFKHELMFVDYTKQNVNKKLFDVASNTDNQQHKFLIKIFEFF